MFNLFLYASSRLLDKHAKQASPAIPAWSPTAVVPHRSTVQAHSCLTSEFGWDPVLSARYERTMEVNIQHSQKQSGEEFKPRTAWDRHPLITPMKVYWEIPLSAPQPLVCRDRNPSGNPGRVESNPLWGSGIETQGV